MVVGRIVAMRTPHSPIRLRTVSHDAPRLGDTAAAQAVRGVTSWLVRSADVARLRRHVLDTAALVGLSGEQAGQFILAINEAVINAIRHAGGVAAVTVVANRPGAVMTVTVSDTGPGFDGDVRPELPPADQDHGRGLWLVRKMCDDVEIDSSPRGTVVRLRATARLDRG
jgi:anti-sigma regulatory factor (Ser/Thr protein kinase)